MKIKKVYQINEDFTSEIIRYIEQKYNTSEYILYGIDFGDKNQEHNIVQLDRGSLEECSKSYQEFENDDSFGYDEYFVVKETYTFMPDVLIAHKYNI